MVAGERGFRLEVQAAFGSKSRGKGPGIFGDPNVSPNTTAASAAAASSTVASGTPVEKAPPCQDAVLFGDEEGKYILYPIGRHVAFRHLGTNETIYAHESTRVQDITVCATSPDRGLLAVCEKCSTEPYNQISVYNLRQPGTRPASVLEELGGAVGRLTSLAFSTDEEAELLFLAADGPDSKLLVALNWRENKVLARITYEHDAPERISLSPATGDVMAVSGQDFFRLYAVLESEFEALPEITALTDSGAVEGDAISVVDHAWVLPGDSTCLICTGDGSVHHLDTVDMIVKQTITAPFEEQPAMPLCVRAFQEGFIIAGTGGTVAIWDLHFEHPPSDAEDEMEAEEGEEPESPRGTCHFEHRLSAQVRETAFGICNLDAAGCDDKLQFAFGFEDGQIGHISGRSLSDGRFGDMDCKILYGGCHSEPVTGLCIAMHRPVFVSISRRESTLRVWNYAVETCDLVREFPGEDLTGVAIHPLGFLLAVTFSDRVRFMQLLATELQQTRELQLRAAAQPKFSQGGHYVAIVQGKMLFVYSTRTFAKLATIRSHSQIASYSFEPDDKTIMILGADGCLDEWCMHTWQKLHDFSGKNSETHAMAAGTSGRAWCGMLLDPGPDSKEDPKCIIRSFHHCTERKTEEVILPNGPRPVALCQHSGPGGACVIAGTASGTVWTLTDFNLPVATYKEYGLHSGTCSALCWTGDSRLAVSAGEDGTIFLLAARGVDVAAFGGVPKFGTEQRSMAEGDFVMIPRGEIQVRQDELVLLQTENATLHSRLAEEATRLQADTKRRVQEARQKDQETIQELREKYEALQQTATAKERESLRVLKTMEAAHVAAADSYEVSFDKRLRCEADRYVDLERELDHLAQKMDALRDEATRQYDQQGQKQQAERHRMLSDKNAEIKKLKELIDFTKHRFDTMLDQEGMEHDHEASKLKQQCEAELDKQRMVEYKLKKEQDTLLRGLELMQKEQETAQRAQDDAEMQITGLKKNLDELGSGVSDLKRERRERESVLREKELEISSYKSKVSTLNKFKHVLDFRLREVSHSLQPKEQMIGQLKVQLKELESDFERQLDVQRHLEGQLEQKVEQINRMTGDSTRLRELSKKKDRAIFEFQTDVDAFVHEEQDIRNWPEAILRLYKKHVDPEKFLQGDESLPMQELSRQIGVMGNKVVMLSGKSKADDGAFRKDIADKTHDNSLLIQEVSELRVEQKALQRQLKDLDLQVRLAEAKVQQQSKDEAEAAKALTNGAEREDSEADDGALSLLPEAVRLFFKGAGHELVATEAAAKSKLQGTMLKQVKPTGQSTAKKAAVRKATLEERRRVQKMLLAADLSNQQIQMQALENKLLRDQVTKVTRQKEEQRRTSQSEKPPGPGARGRTLAGCSDEEGGDSSPENSTAAAAGGGLAAVRAATGWRPAQGDFLN
eukprot:TRINITY_DN17520_c0_g1_i1.p1 TRINITY_DN17520_c0_g1~~TRINITY_DN17520_c0_g1_i1.p1  ORF type:complete len:1419 (-),score=422.29 TRINITY_DN17520_c0_g1_i1:36-4292(-)